MFFIKIDEICELVSDDVSKVYKSKIVRDVVNRVVDFFVIFRFNVFLVKNYEKEYEF